MKIVQVSMTFIVVLYLLIVQIMGEVFLELKSGQYPKQLAIEPN